MNTRDDTQDLRKIIDPTPLISLTILFIHLYLSCYQAFKEWGWTAEITERVVDGKSVFKSLIDSGSNQVNLNVSELKKGQYILEIAGYGDKQVLKFIK